MASQFDTLATDVETLTAQTQALKDAVTQGLADISAEIEALKAQVAAGAPDLSAQLAAVESAVADLGTVTGTIQAADPGAPAAPPAS